MKFKRKSSIESKISTSSMPDIIFMLLIFFMVTTVLREYSGLPISLPKAERIEKLESKRHTASDPQLTVSLKADLAARMEVISSIHNELRKADALRLNYSTKVKVPGQ